MEVKEGIGTTTTLTVVKLKPHKATTDMRGVIDQIMRGPPKGKKSQVSEHIGVEPNDKEIRVGEPTEEVRTVDGITYHVLEYLVVRERVRFPEQGGGSKRNLRRNRKRELSPNQPKIDSFFAKRIKVEPPDVEMENTILEKSIGTETGAEETETSPKLIDQNHGRVRIIWYEEEGVLEAFALLESGLSNLWMKFLQIRDKNFGRKIAKNMLDSDEVLSAEFINLIGNNMGKESTVYRNPKFAHFSMKEKYGVIKTFKSKLRSTVVESKEFKSFEGNKILSPSRIWEVQTGQMKIPVNKNLTEEQLLKIFPLLVNFSKESESEDNWDVLDNVSELDSSDPRVKKSTEEIIDDLKQCVEAEIEGEEHKPKTFDINSKLRCQMPDSLNGSNSVELVFKGRKEKHIPWIGGIDTRDGLDITVKDIVKAVAVAKKDIGRIHVKFPSQNFRHTFPVHELIDTQIQNDEGAVLKLGSVYYEVTPRHDHHMEVNKKFLEVLKAHLVGEDFHHFLLPWQRKGPKSFNIDDMFKVCFAGKETPEIKDHVVKVLTNKISLLEGNTNQIYQKYRMNCSLMKSSKLEVPKNCSRDKLSYLLAHEQTVNSETLNKYPLFSKRPNKEKEVLDSLKAQTSVCKFREGRLEVVDPYLTKQQVEQLRRIPGTKVCIPRLIQFLRMHLPMDEGQYNELYLLSNCTCHSDGWIFLVFDRVLVPGKIEICDVLAFNEEENRCVLLHVKEGIDAEHARAVCSQVRVSCEEIVRTLTSDSESGAFKKLFKEAFNPPEHSLYREALKSTIKEKMMVRDQDDFVRKVRDSKFDICVSFADKNSNRWENMKDINLKMDLSEVVGDAAMLEAFKQLGYLTKSKVWITQKMINTPREQIADEVREVTRGLTKTSINQTIINVFSSVTGEGNADSLRRNFISRMLINDLHDTFQGLSEQRVSLNIMPIPSDV